jgi:hypothetical protein
MSEISEQEFNVLKKEVEKINSRLSRIEQMLGISKGEPDEIDFDFACAEYLKGNKKLLKEYYKKKNKEEEGKEV